MCHKGQAHNISKLHLQAHHLPPCSGLPPKLRRGFSHLKKDGSCTVHESLKRNIVGSVCRDTCTTARLQLCFQFPQQQRPVDRVVWSDPYNYFKPYITETENYLEVYSRWLNVRQKFCISQNDTLREVFCDLAPAVALSWAKTKVDEQTLSLGPEHLLQQQRWDAPTHCKRYLPEEHFLSFIIQIPLLLWRSELTKSGITRQQDHKAFQPQYRTLQLRLLPYFCSVWRLNSSWNKALVASRALSWGFEQ